MSSSSRGNPAESQPQVAGKRLFKKINPSATTYEQPQGKMLTKKTTEEKDNQALLKDEKEDANGLSKQKSLFSLNNRAA